MSTCIYCERPMRHPTESGYCPDCFERAYAPGPTGRMGDPRPALQPIPVPGSPGRGIRQAFMAREGALMADIDYSSLEIRLAAQMEEDDDAEPGT